MKHRITVVLMACAAMIAGPGMVLAQADVNVSAGFSAPGVSAGIQINSPSDFYQPLASYGNWVDVPQYGRCFQPADMPQGWQPYTDGQWVWTDAGWCWQSDQPWGWACFHYGSWYDDPSMGWVWIPGTEWAPAWVDWRYSDDYVGWAPCGPNRVVVAPSLFTFVNINRFHGRFHGRHDFIVDNPTIINRTRVVNNFERRSINVDGHERTIFANRGPGVDRIRHATGQDFTPRPVGQVFRESHMRANRSENMRGNEHQRHEQQPSPTGREQERNYQRQNQQPQLNENHNRQTPQQRPSPTGREQQRNYQQPNQQPRLNENHNARPEQQTPEQRVRPEQRTPETPHNRPEAMPPTGRQQPRVFQTPRQETPRQEVPNPSPRSEQRREVPAQPERPATPPERSLPPTGRETPRATPPATREAPPAARQAPERQAPTPAPGHDNGHGNDRRNRDGQ
ncbi:MAG TPA: DUF6600 domain-containing protein [Candidatus Angelobacter sp.]|nr:DUF6600 domain-containing protein [Candidatus Angelobacter sp.]